MRTREKQRIFKRFMEGEMTMQIFNYFNAKYTLWSIEQAIRECVNEIKKGDK